MDHLRVTLCLATLLLWLPAPLYAAPLLRCDVTYAGATQTIDTRPVTEPYPVPSVDIGGRFWFKPLMVGGTNRVDYIKIYAYLDTAQQPLLIQVATYLPPFKRSRQPVDMTGTQRLYAGPAERELMYRCTLQETQP